jgi:hypothetical protein
VKPLPKKFGELGGGRMSAGDRIVVGFTSNMLQAFARPPKPGRPAPDGFLDGDVVARFDAVALGDVTLCAVGITGDLLDLDLVRTMIQHLADLEVGCTYAKLTERDQVILVETPQMKRFP